MAGILSGTPMGALNDPRAMGLLQAGLGILSASGPSRMPVSLGQAIAQGGQQGLQAYDQTQKFNMERQLHGLQIQQLKMSLEKAKTDSAFRQKMLTELQSGAGPLSALPQHVRQGLVYTLGGMPEVGGAITRSGEPVNIPGIGAFQRDGNGGLSTIPGVEAALRDRKRIEAEEAARMELIAVPDGRGGTRMMTKSQAAALFGANPANVKKPLPQGVPESERDAFEAVESGRVSAAYANAPTLGRAPSKAEEAAQVDEAKSEVDRKTKMPQAQLQVNTQRDDLGRLKKAAKEIMDSAGLERSVGLLGAFPSVPGGTAATTDALIESLKAQVSGMKLQAMREASKTGGAVGQVTEKEWPRLESMIVALGKKMDPLTFKRKLGELIEAIESAESNINNAFQSEYGKFLPQQENNVTRKRFNPKTGKIE